MVRVKGWQVLRLEGVFKIKPPVLSVYMVLSTPRSRIAIATWARTQGYCKRGSGGQRKIEKFRATFWDSKLL